MSSFSYKTNPFHDFQSKNYYQKMSEMFRLNDFYSKYKNPYLNFGLNQLWNGHLMAMNLKFGLNCNYIDLVSN